MLQCAQQHKSNQISVQDPAVDCTSTDTRLPIDNTHKTQVKPKTRTSIHIVKKKHAKTSIKS